MKRVMRKIFVSVLALAMIVGIIGVQKMNVSAADIKYYSHVDVKADVDIFVGEAEAAQKATFKSVDKVVLVYDDKPVDLQFAGKRQEDGKDEFGFVVDSTRVVYAGSYYKLDGNDFRGNNAVGRFGDNFTEIQISATITVDGTDKAFYFVVSNKDAFQNNKCSGQNDEKYRGIDIYLSAHIDEAVSFKFMNGEKVESEGSIEKGAYIPEDKIPTLVAPDGKKFDGWSIEDAEDNTLYSAEEILAMPIEEGIVFIASLSDVKYADVTVIHNYNTLDKKDNSTTTVKDTETYEHQVVGDTITIKAVNKDDFSICADISHKVDAEKNEVTFDYNKEIDTTPNPPVEEEKKEEKPIIPDYIPVVPIEEKKEEVVEIIEEEVPEAPVEEPVEEEEEVVEEIEVEIPEIPEALPKTGTASVELFFGLGSFFMTIGAAFVLFARRKN